MPLKCGTGFVSSVTPWTLHETHSVGKPLQTSATGQKLPFSDVKKLPAGAAPAGTIVGFLQRPK